MSKFIQVGLPIEKGQTLPTLINVNQISHVVKRDKCLTITMNTGDELVIEADLESFYQVIREVGA